MKATLVYCHKERIKGRYILELKIHSVENSAQYPDGVKYGLICKDLKTGRRVLMDNHHPKGHHIHLDSEELDYEFRGNELLVGDFEALVLRHLEVRL
jgi:Family of unknown function (DUF6516)